MRVPFLAVFVFVRCVMMDAPLSLILGGSFVLGALLVRRANVLSMPKFMELQRRKDRVGTLMNEKLTGARSIRAFSRQEYEIEKLTEANRQVLEKAIDANRVINLISPLVQVIMNLVVMILMIGPVQMRSGLISLSGLIVYIQYSIQQPCKTLRARLTKLVQPCKIETGGFCFSKSDVGRHKSARKSSVSGHVFFELFWICQYWRKT